MPILRYELLTPCFCAGVDRNEPELRAASVRGQLRFWTRALFGVGAAEYYLFGGVQGKANGYDDEAVASSIILRVKTLTEAKPIEALLCPHDKKKGVRPAIARDSEFELRWFERFAPLADRIQKFQKVLDAWSLLGGLGARVTRAAGSVWWQDYVPSVTMFNERMAALGLPPTVRVAVLDKVSQDPEELRKIATDTVNGIVSGTFRGDPLGVVDFQTRARKASPLKLKVGRFDDGYRLIAVADNRDGRGGDLPSAIKSMQERQKPLAKLLIAAKL